MKGLLKIVLLAVVLVGVARIGWSFVETGHLPNPVNDLQSVAGVVQSWVGGGIDTQVHGAL